MIGYAEPAVLSVKSAFVRRVHHAQDTGEMASPCKMGVAHVSEAGNARPTERHLPD